MAGRKIVVFNRKASHEYFLEERFEAGLVLQGTEIKSIRQGHVQIRDAYISFTNDEAYVKEMHILGYELATGSIMMKPEYESCSCIRKRSVSCSRR